MDSLSFSQYVEQTFGKPVHFCIYAVLEWIMIIMLFIDGVISFAANEFAHFFDLKIPCLLCTRIDHVLAQRGSDYYYNDSICEHHQKDISSLAYCHIHRKLSDVRFMCEGCLLSFATENKSNSDTYKSLVGVLGSNLECSVEDDHKIHLKLPARGKDGVQLEKTSKHHCCCCGDPRKVKMAPLPQKLAQNPVMKADNLPKAPTPSPRGLVPTKHDEIQTFDHLSHVQYSELKYMSDTESEIPEDDDKSTVLIALDSQAREDTKAASVPLLPDLDDSNEDSACRTPSFVRLNKFFGIAYPESANASPRWLQRIPRRFPGEKTESGAESMEGNSASEAEGETILHHLKRQVRLDRKTLIAMYMELDEERSASAVAANQALAMITRLQAEKAAMQMEALQYQRMMEEQAEYDQEALQVMKDMLNKREEEIKILQDEMKGTYRGRSEYDEVSDNNYQAFSFRCNSFASGKSDCGSTHANIELEVENGGEYESNSAQTGPSPLGNTWNAIDDSLDFEGERLYLLDQLRVLEDKINSSQNAGVGADLINPKEEERGERGTIDVTREISHLYEKLLALETDREFLKRALRSLQKGEEGTQLLKEIAQQLRDLRQKESMPLQC